MKLLISCLSFLICFTSPLCAYLQKEMTPTIKYIKPAEITEVTSGLEGIDCVYVINLDIRPDKWNRTKTLLEEKGVHPNRFSAVNGWQIPYSTIQELSGCYPTRLQGGPIGCLLSHLSIYQDALTRGYKTIWIIEDDPDFVGDIHTLPLRIKELSTIDPQWDILYTDTDWRNDKGVCIIPSTEKARPDQPMKSKEFYLERESVSDHLMRIRSRYGTTSMIISQNGIKKLIDHFSHTYLWTAIDCDIHFIPDIRQYGIVPPVATNLMGDAVSDTKKWSTLNPNNKILKPLIVADIMGQLGNQLFIIAATYALAMDHGAVPVFPDLSKNPHLGIPFNREHLYSHMNIDMEPLIKPIAYQYQEPFFHYHPIPYVPNMKIRGYFQSEKYFSHHREEILKLFAPPKKILEELKTKYPEILDNPNTVAVHFRNYDKEDPCHNNWLFTGLDYYLAAINQFPEDATFVVFSNDIEWCKKNFAGIPRKFVFIENNPHTIDFYLMSLCKHQITCNSTFSWWAAYLNPNPNKVITTPKMWLNPKFISDTQDLIPESWIKL